MLFSVIFLIILSMSSFTVSYGESLYTDNVTIKRTTTLTEDTISESMQYDINILLNEAEPGSIIEIPNGTYSNVILLISKSGEENNPITLKAKENGKVIIKENSAIKVTGQYVNIEGIKFENCTSEQIVRFQPQSANCILKECIFLNCNPVDSDTTDENYPSQKWVYIAGKDNKVSDCYFKGKDSLGQMIEIVREYNLDTPDNHIIENCYFGDFKPGVFGTNGYETIRIGRSDTSLSSSESTIRNCFFENCNGEEEVISVKSGENFILNNTFYVTRQDNPQGVVCLRQGNGSLVEGNIFITDVKFDSSVKLENRYPRMGIGINGENHIVRNNYFYNLPEKYRIFYIFDGTENYIDNNLLHKFWTVKNLLVQNNTFVGIDRGIITGHRYEATNEEDWRVVPPEGKIENNVFVTFKGNSALIDNSSEPLNEFTYSNNFIYGKNSGYSGSLPEGIKEEKFSYSMIDGFLVAQNGLGADIEELKKAPLSPLKIIPQWIVESENVTFSAAEEDYLNNKDAELNNIVPFDITYIPSIDGGSLKLYIDGKESIKSNETVKNNPDIYFTVQKEQGKKIAGWYINDVLITEDNIKNYNASVSEDNKRLTFSNIANNYDVKVKFTDLQKLPDILNLISYTEFKGLSDISSPLIINNEEISGYYYTYLVKMAMYDDYSIKEAGFMISKISGNYNTIIKSIYPVTKNGAFGILFYNIDPDTTYYLSPYAVYIDESGIETTLTGEEISFIAK